jgi:hypothetical protein
MAGFQLIIYGRFWVFTEVPAGEVFRARLILLWPTVCRIGACGATKAAPGTVGGHSPALNLV